MISKLNSEFMLRKGRDEFYRGFLCQAVRQAGLNKLLSDPYWKLAHRLSGDVQIQTIECQKLEFITTTHTEFMRFRNLTGERPILEGLLRSLEPTDVVYDVGANVGTYTCFVASELGSRRTVAFEPEPQNAARLRDNLELNELDIELVEIALSDGDGTVELALSGNEAGEGEHAIATDQATETIDVELARRDAMIERRDLPTPTVVKIDVEGAELSVLQGLSETLRNHVRLAYVEVHPEKLPEFGDSAPEVRAPVKNIGFVVLELSSRGSNNATKKILSIF